jgi:16S rRNA processing protein RimM
LIQDFLSGVAIPDDLVLVGYVSGAYGLNGWVRIKPYANHPEALLHAKRWWFDKPQLHDVDMLQAKMHSTDVVAQLMGIVDREAAEGLRGTAVQISRAHFPALADGEFYWADLIGLKVENLVGETLGWVSEMMDNGAHPILIVSPDEADENGSAYEPTPIILSQTDSAKSVKLGRKSTTKTPTEILIPFVDEFVKTIDQAEGNITVDWQRDY